MTEETRDDKARPPRGCLPKRADPMRSLELERWLEDQAGELGEQTFKEGSDVSAFFVFRYAKETDIVPLTPVLKVCDLSS
ncbi:hypothetical protein NDU88_002994 [Pleurodeles waltl]|uniref:Uncharacterized protein n=1 Tax=Pleurodeles waltl TaxID=8319 RepID=A0AAV7W0W9_PLEWA|nr:hypothetical protein NDU88_002994 [Pleurodeles waltl]